MPKIAKNQCLRANYKPKPCNQAATSRGLCKNCYMALSNLIRKKITTWAELELIGASTPLQEKKPKNLFLDWIDGLKVKAVKKEGRLPKIKTAKRVSRLKTA